MHCGPPNQNLAMNHTSFVKIGGKLRWFLLFPERPETPVGKNNDLIVRSLAAAVVRSWSSFGLLNDERSYPSRQSMTIIR